MALSFRAGAGLIQFSEGSAVAEGLSCPYMITVPLKIHGALAQLQRNRTIKQFIEISLTTLVWLCVTFPLPTILANANNANRLGKAHRRSIFNC